MKKVFDQTFRDIKRGVNKKVLKVPSIEQKVLDATSNEPWGPHGTHLADIAQASRNYHEYQMIMSVVWKRLSDSGKNWRHVFKALAVLEYLVANGSERVIEDIREHAYQISTLSSFQYIDSTGRDQGSNIRKKSQSLVALVNDKEKIQEAREKAAANRDKLRNTSGDEARYGSRDEDRNGYGYRDDEYRGRSRDGGGDYGPRSRSSDRDRERAYEDDGHHSSRGSNAKFEDVSPSPDASRLEPKSSGQNFGAPPSYEDAVSDTPPPAANHQETSNSVAPAAATPPPAAAVTSNQENEAFDVFDPRGASPAPAAPSAASGGAEVDLFGSLSDSFSSNTLALVPSEPNNPPTRPNPSQTFVAASQPFDDPFGDGPFRAVPSTDGVSLSTPFGEPHQSFAPTTVNDMEFGDSFDQTIDILADILPPTGPGPSHSVSSSETVFMSQPGQLSTENVFHSQNGQPAPQTGFAPQPSQPFSQMEIPAQPNQTTFSSSFPAQGGQSVSQSGFLAAQGGQSVMQSGFPAQNGQSVLQSGFPAQGGQSVLQSGFLAAQGGQSALQSGFPAAQGGQSVAQGAAQGSQPGSQLGFSAAQGDQPGSQPGFPVAQGGQPVSQPGFQAQGGQPVSQPGFPVAQGGLPVSQPGFPAAQGGQPMPQPGFQVAQGGQPVSQPGFLAAQGGQSVLQPGFAGSQNASLGGFPSQMGTITQAAFPNSNGQHGQLNNFYAGGLQPQGSSAPVPPLTQAGFPNSNGQPGQLNNFYGGGLQPQGSSAPLPPLTQVTTIPGPQYNASNFYQPPAVTASTGALAIVTQQPANEKFETKSTVWADTLNRGLVNLNISGSKTNPLSDIGIDFEAINRKEKRMEKPSKTPVTSTVTMGKAMGSGSGMGRAGAGALRPAPNPMVGSGMGTAPGYGGMNNMPQNMMNIGQGFQMQPPSGAAFPPGNYNPMLGGRGGGGYGQQQPYGGYR